MLPFIKRNSVLNSPTPSAPSLTAFAASSALPILAASITRLPSLVTVCLLIYFLSSITLSSYCFFFLAYIFLVMSLGDTNTSPYAPSTIMSSPSLTSLHIPFTLRTAGISKALASIDACEVSPPFSDIMPAICTVSIFAVIDGCISSAIIIVLSGSCVRSILLTPRSIAVNLSLISSISVTRWAIASLSILRNSCFKDSQAS